MSNKFMTKDLVTAWAAVRSEEKYIERLQLAGERPELELRTIPLIDAYDETLRQSV